MKVHARVNFDNLLQEWDGFGINYVETAQTPDYSVDGQDYGGFSTLAEEKRREIVEMIFGEDGLKPGVFKMFIDCFQQDENHINKPGVGEIDLSNYDHETTTSWMRYFIRSGLELTRKRGDDMRGIATLYGPPAFMTKIRKVRGRDLDPRYKLEMAKYIVAFGKYMREVEKFPIEYLSIHNEGEDYFRWPEDGLDPNIGTGHDYNLYWTPEDVAGFLPLIREVADAAGGDMLPTPGECSGWSRFSHWGYADALAESKDALDAMGLITSHGFYGYGLCGEWSNAHTNTGISRIQEKRPELHAWVTSTSWSKMDAAFGYELQRSIYDAKVNAIIPWAAVQLFGGWVGGDPNPGCAFAVNGDGTYTVQKGYYYYKQYCRFGRPGMRIATASCTFTPCSVAAFEKNGTNNPNAIVVANTWYEDKQMDLTVIGGGAKYQMYRTGPDEHFVDLGIVGAVNGVLEFECPADSVTTFVEV